jgi:hypothetical protein
MRFIKKLLAILGLAVAFSPLTPLHAKPSSLNFIQCPWECDGRQWKPLNYSIQSQTGLIQYLPDGDKAETWREMVATQWYENAKQTPSEYFSYFLQHVGEIFPQSTVNMNIIQKTNLSLTAEWWTENDQNNPRYGLVKIFTAYPDIYMLSYTTRDTAMVAKIKPIWLPMLQAAQLNYTALECIEQ